MVDIRSRIQARPAPEFQATMGISLPSNAMEFLNDAMLAKPEQQKVITQSDIETNARIALFKMFQSAKLEEPYSFKTIRFGGRAFVHAMRNQLGRARRQMKEEQKAFTKFKFLVVSIEQYPTHDLVTVMRSQLPSLKTKNLYGELIDLMTEAEGQETGASNSDDNSTEGTNGRENTCGETARCEIADEGD